LRRITILTSAACLVFAAYAASFLYFFVDDEAIPLVYARSMAVVKPWVRGWWEFGKTSANYADLRVDPSV